MAECHKILVVDDERGVLKALRRLFLDEDDYDILLAESGSEGLEVLEEEGDISLVISDYRMPGMNGVDFLRQVCERWPETIRIVLSGFADTAAVVEAINLGQIYKFIPKPWNDEDLRSTLRVALQHRKLKIQNDHLAEQLQVKNAELKEMNEQLERKVAQRTEALEIRNRVLAVSQGVLDVLPIAVFGVAPDQMIAQCNDLAQALFPFGGMGPLGNDRREVFTAELNQLFDALKTGQQLCGRVTLRQEPWHVEIVRLSGFSAEGIVVALIPLSLLRDNDHV